MLLTTMVVAPSSYRNYLLSSSVFLLSYNIFYLQIYLKFLSTRSSQFLFFQSRFFIFSPSCLHLVASQVFSLPSPPRHSSLLHGERPRPIHRHICNKGSLSPFLLGSKFCESSSDLPPPCPWPWRNGLWPPCHPHHDRLLLHRHHGLGILLHVSGFKFVFTVFVIIDIQGMRETLPWTSCVTEQLNEFSTNHCFTKKDNDNCEAAVINNNYSTIYAQIESNLVSLMD